MEKQQPQAAAAHIESMSDKAVLQVARTGNLDAVALLLRRWAIKVTDAEAVLAGWKKLAVPSMNAAKRVALSAAAG